jgi:hypothetical protein
MKTVVERGVVHTGAQQCRAVLAVWTERRSVKQVCVEMAVSGKVFQLWQERAMEGLLKALQPKEGREEERGPALNPRMKRLLDRKAMEQDGKLPRLSKRLANLSGQTELATSSG